MKKLLIFAFMHLLVVMLALSGCVGSEYDNLTPEPKIPTEDSDMIALLGYDMADIQVSNVKTYEILSVIIFIWVIAVTVGQDKGHLCGWSLFASTS